MCGIAGVFSLDGSKVNLQALRDMTGAVRHRGPDGDGHWISRDGDVGLGHRRLAILDLSERGAQPMHYLGRYTVTLNGEIYNYIELREELIRKGHTFVSESDTEVLLAAYSEYGVSVLDRLDGMFAFAIWDEQESTLFCARDRFGEKPFFYHYVPSKSFAFASEIKSLFAFGAPRFINNRMLFNYLAYDVIENPRGKSETFFEGISKLEAANYVLVDRRGAVTKRRYWGVPEINVDQRISFEDACERFRELFTQSVKRRLRSDVPVGTSLSGGLDSSSVLCTISNLLNGNGHGQKTFSARFHNSALDEGEYMRLAAEAAGAMQHFAWPDERTLLDNIDEVFYHQEEPFGGASILAQWEVMKLAKRENVTVLLDGQGADETLGGYVHYFRTLFLELYSKDRSRFREERREYEDLHKRRFVSDARFRLEATRPGLLRLMGNARRRFSRPSYVHHLHPDFAAEYRTEPPPFENHNDLNETLRYSTQGYGLEKLLRFADRNSMAFSREVRLPFLNHELVEFLFTLPPSYKISGGWTKRILRYAMEPILPAPITWRVEKLGFEPPQEQWLKNPEARKLIEGCNRDLIERRVLSQDSECDEWRCLMASKLMAFAASDWSQSSTSSVRPPAEKFLGPGNLSVGTGGATSANEKHGLRKHREGSLADRG
jgi:asparagine synthase (glutamine-hydrolysing)